jgi:hypothetical protein
MSASSGMVHSGNVIENLGLIPGRADSSETGIGDEGIGQVLQEWVDLQNSVNKTIKKDPSNKGNSSITSQKRRRRSRANSFEGEKSSKIEAQVKKDIALQKSLGISRVTSLSEGAFKVLERDNTAELAPEERNFRLDCLRPYQDLDFTIIDLDSRFLADSFFVSMSKGINLRKSGEISSITVNVKDFFLKNFSNTFTDEELPEAVEVFIPLMELLVSKEDDIDEALRAILEFCKQKESRVRCLFNLFQHLMLEELQREYFEFGENGNLQQREKTVSEYFEGFSLPTKSLQQVSLEAVKEESYFSNRVKDKHRIALDILSNCQNLQFTIDNLGSFFLKGSLFDALLKTETLRKSKGVSTVIIDAKDFLLKNFLDIFSEGELIEAFEVFVLLMRTLILEDKKMFKRSLRELLGFCKRNSSKNQFLFIFLERLILVEFRKKYVFCENTFILNGVKKLNLYYQNVEKFTFSSLKNIESLDLRDSVGLSSEVFNSIPGKKLKVLKLRNLSVFNFSFFEFMRLEELELNAIVYLKNDVFRSVFKQYIKKISLCLSDVSGIDVSQGHFSRLENLEELNLRSVRGLTAEKFNQIPKNKLRVLDLGFVNVAGFDFSGCVNLEELVLIKGDDGLTPEQFDTIPKAKLRKLNLQGWDVRIFDFSKCESLKRANYEVIQALKAVRSL